MRNFLLGLSVLLVIVSLTGFTLMQAFEMTALNEAYVNQKVEEHVLFKALINSMSEDYSGSGIDLGEFVEVVGSEAIKPLVKNVVSGVLLYLKNPEVKSVELGVPENFFSEETTVSLDQVLTKDQVSFLENIKTIIQALIAFKNVALVVFAAFIFVIIISAKSLPEKAKWVGASLLISGILVIGISFLGNSAFASVLDANLPNLGSTGETVAPLAKDILADWSSLSLYFGLAYFFSGIFIAWIAVALIGKIGKSDGFEQEKEHRKKIAELKKLDRLERLR